MSHVNYVTRAKCADKVAMIIQTSFSRLLMSVLLQNKKSMSHVTRINRANCGDKVAIILPTSSALQLRSVPLNSWIGRYVCVCVCVCVWFV